MKPYALISEARELARFSECVGDELAAIAGGDDLYETYVCCFHNGHCDNVVSSLDDCPYGPHECKNTGCKAGWEC